MSILVICDTTSSGTLQWTSDVPEDPEHVPIADNVGSRHSAPPGRQPAALPVSSHSGPADAVTTPSTAVASSLPASAAVSDSLPLVHALVSPAALYCTQPNGRVPPTRPTRPAAAGTHSSSASASTGLAAGPLSTRNASLVTVTQASPHATCTAPVHCCSCQHLCHC